MTTLSILCQASWGDVAIPTFDEFGGSTFGGPRTFFPFSILPDPSGGVPGSVLVYSLPFGTTPGDVVLVDPGSGKWSDVIRFIPNGPFGSDLIFYSNGGDGLVSPADVPSLPALQPNSVFIPETEFTSYGSHEGQPGSSSPLGMPYEFITEGHLTFSIPDAEATFTLFGLGVASVLAMKSAFRTKLS